MRGRSRGKGPNPLTRSYESNGPDVKVRGTAQHIAEKYGQLARDAQASGDPVAAENYFQHAEHYLRIIAGAQENMRQQYGGGRSDDDSDYDDDDSNGYTHGYAQPDRGSQPQRVAAEEFDPAQQPQPPSFDPRPDRQSERGFQPRGRGDRRERYGRNQQDNRGQDNRGNVDAEADQREDAGQARASYDSGGKDMGERPVRGRRRPVPTRPDEAEQPALPDFLTKPVSRNSEPDGEAAPAEDAGDEKPKRRRAATTTRRTTRKADAEGGDEASEKPAAKTRRTTRKAASADDGAHDAGSGEDASDKTAAE